MFGLSISAAGEEVRFFIRLLVVTLLLVYFSLNLNLNVKIDTLGHARHLECTILTRLSAIIDNIS